MTHTHAHILAKGPCRAFCDNRFHAAVNTNEVTELFNKLLKYSYLPPEKMTTLSGIVTLIIDSFLPETSKVSLFKL